MGYQRYPRNTDPEADYYNRSAPQDYGTDYGSGREFSYSSAREYEAAGEIGGNTGRGYGRRRSLGEREPYGRTDYYGDRYRGNDRGGRPNYGSYASDGHRFTDTGEREYGRQPQGYDYENRGFMDRAGDEVRSWFGDEDAERRREMDQRYDDRSAERWDSPYGRDSDYHHWRRQQMAALDRDYDEYRREHRQKFHNEFGSWRQDRTGQRNALGRVAEHMDVVGSDGEHIGTVDKVRGDRIILTKSDPEAGGHHHSIPSRWIDRVDDKVTIRKTAGDAQAHWRDEDRNSAMFGTGEVDYEIGAGSHMLGRSFSGTY